LILIRKHGLLIYMGILSVYISPTSKYRRLVWDLMVSGLNTGLPPILGRRMIVSRTGLTRLAVKVLTVRSSIHGIIVPEQPTLAQFWQQ
jgi:hypothetical protein